MGLYQDCTRQDRCEFHISCFLLIRAIWTWSILLPGSTDILHMTHGCVCVCVCVCVSVSAACRAAVYLIYELLSMVLKNLIIPGPASMRSNHYSVSALNQSSVLKKTKQKTKYSKQCLHWMCRCITAANVWVSKKCVMTRGAEGGEERRGGKEEGGRETLQSALPPSVCEAAAAAAAALRRSSGGSGSCTLQPGTDVSNRTGGNFPSSRDGFSHHGRMLLPAGDTEDAPEPGNELLLGLKWACEEFWVKFSRGGWTEWRSGTGCGCRWRGGVALRCSARFCFVMLLADRAVIRLMCLALWCMLRLN